MLFHKNAVTTANRNYTEEKLQQVILYFLEHINNVHLGRTKLMKLLYFVDFDHYEAHGVPVTGATYRKLPHGPYPDKVEKLIQMMEKRGLEKHYVRKFVMEKGRWLRKQAKKLIKVWQKNYKKYRSIHCQSSHAS